MVTVKFKELPVRMRKFPFWFLLCLTSLSFLLPFSAEIRGTRPLFWDMENTVVLWPKCFDTYGLQTFSPQMAYEPDRFPCSGYNYGYMTWPLYKVMSLVSSSHAFWAITLSVFVLVLVTWRTSTQTWGEKTIIFMVLITPPFSLLISSGNPDILNILLLIIAGLALVQNRLTAFYLATTFVFVHKFYGVADWLLISIKEFKSISLRARVTIAVLAASAISMVAIQVLKKGYFQMGVDAANNHYGLGIWDNYLRKAGLEYHEFLVHSFGIVSMCLIAYALKVLSNRRGNFLSSLVEPSNSILALVFYTVFIFSYLATANVDYRLAFLGIAVIFDIEHFMRGQNISKAFFAIIFSSLYFVYQWEYIEVFGLVPIQAIGDLLLHFATAYALSRAFTLYSIRKNSHNRLIS